MELIVVLGNRTPSITKKRVDRALEEFYRSPCDRFNEFEQKYEQTKYIFFSGGSSDGVSVPTGADMMETYALSRGLDKKYILKETVSMTTVENMIETGKFIKDANRSVSFSPRLTICTSSFHIRRAVVLAKFYLGEYSLNFIHTNEPVSKKEVANESMLISRFVDFYSNISLEIV